MNPGSLVPKSVLLPTKIQCFWYIQQRQAPTDDSNFRDKHTVLICISERYTYCCGNSEEKVLVSYRKVRESFTEEVGFDLDLESQPEFPQKETSKTERVTCRGKDRLLTL